MMALTWIGCFLNKRKRLIGAYTLGLVKLIFALPVEVTGMLEKITPKISADGTKQFKLVFWEISLKLFNYDGSVSIILLTNFGEWFT